MNQSVFNAKPRFCEIAPYKHPEYYFQEREEAERRAKSSEDTVDPLLPYLCRRKPTDVSWEDFCQTSSSRLVSDLADTSDICEEYLSEIRTRIVDKANHMQAKVEQVTDVTPLLPSLPLSLTPSLPQSLFITPSLSRPTPAFSHPPTFSFPMSPFYLYLSLLPSLPPSPYLSLFLSLPQSLPPSLSLRFSLSLYVFFSLGFHYSISLFLSRLSFTLSFIGPPAWPGGTAHGLPRRRSRV